jgi:hypothetical protein
MNAIEGSLDIIWENNAPPAATPRYMVLFSRYQNFKSGAQPHKSIVGEEALADYLIAIGFKPADAKRWIREVSAKGTVSIPNVMMPEDQMAAYERAA